jgi:hypothetical protein
MHVKPLLIVAALGVNSVLGCAGSFDGELDGKQVPTFRTAAFGGFRAPTGGYWVTGFFSSGNSCDDGADLQKAQRRWSTAFDQQEQQVRAERWAALINERLPERSWYGQFTLMAADDDELDDGEVDLSDQRDLFLSSFQLCQRSGQANARNGVLELDDDCYTAIDGDVDVKRSEDETELSLVSEADIEFIDETGDDEGELQMSITLTECEPLADELEATLAPPVR